MDPATAGLSKRENSATGAPVHTNICAVDVTGPIPKPSVERLLDHSGNRQAISPSLYPAGDKTHTPLPSPINVQALEALLVGYDRDKRNFLTQGFHMGNGFRICYGGQPRTEICKNHPSALLNKNLISEKIQQELKLGRIAGPFKNHPFTNFRSSPLGLVPKKEPGTFRLIFCICIIILSSLRLSRWQILHKILEIAFSFSSCRLLVFLL